jgi:3-oxoacyl-[acyl-carrier-protein] synthase-3
MSERFPFSPAGAALLCTSVDDEGGLDRTYWMNRPADRDSFNATIGLVDHRNVLRFNESSSVDEELADAADQAVNRCLRETSAKMTDFDAVVVAPAGARYHGALATKLGVPTEQVIVADDERMHTASLASAMNDAIKALPSGAQILLVAAGAGIVAEAARYRI